MNIDGMGEALVDQLVDKGLVKNVADIYSLKLGDLMELERMGKKSAEKVLANIEASRRAPLPRILNGLGIPFVGERTGQFLAEAFGDLDKIAAADEDELQKAEEVGPKVSHSIHQFFQEKHNHALIERLRAAGFSFTHAIKKREGGPLAGMTLVLTKHPSHPDARRRQATDRSLREASGGRVGEQAETSYVVAGEEAGSKLSIARRASWASRLSTKPGYSV